MKRDNGTINSYIQQYKPLINREVFKLSELRSFVNSKRNKEISSSTLRTILIGNNDFYKNGYINIARNCYAPQEKFNKNDSVIKYLSNGYDYMPDNLTLGHILKINFQNLQINSYIVFSPKPKEVHMLEKWINIRYIEIKEKKVIEAFKLLYALNAFDDVLSLKKYMKSNEINFNHIIEAYSYLDINTKLIDIELKGIEKKLWKANIWMK